MTGEAGRSDGVFEPGTLHVLLNETQVWAPEWHNLTHVLEAPARPLLKKAEGRENPKGDVQSWLSIQTLRRP